MHCCESNKPCCLKSTSKVICEKLHNSHCTDCDLYWKINKVGSICALNYKVGSILTKSDQFRPRANQNGPTGSGPILIDSL